jgi:hypothetical protein
LLLALNQNPLCCTLPRWTLAEASASRAHRRLR